MEKVGITINVENAQIRNDGKFVYIKVPVKSFKEFDNTIVNESETTIHTLNNNSYIGPSLLELRGGGGFIIKDYNAKNNKRNTSNRED